MALGLQESNTPHILNDLHTAIGLKYVRLNFNICIRNDVDWLTSLSGPQIAVQNSSPRVDLHLEVYLDQMAPEKHNICELEERISLILRQVDGRWMQRQISPFRGEKVYKIDYQILLHDYENFVEKLHQYALTQLDREFTEVLEAKLTED